MFTVIAITHVLLVKRSGQKLKTTFAPDEPYCLITLLLTRCISIAPSRNTKHSVIAHHKVNLLLSARIVTCKIFDYCGGGGDQRAINWMCIS